MSEKTGLELWARVALVVVVLAVVELVVLGSRPGGRLPIVLFVVAIPATGLVAGALLLYSIGRALLRRPALQRGRMPVMLALGGVVWLCTFPLAYPSSHEGHPSGVALTLPASGAWEVRWGGERRRDNPLVLNPSRRFGLALAPVGDARADVVAPAAGVLASYEVVRGSAVLVLTVAPDAHVVLEGLEPESVRLAPGASVQRGALLGSLPSGVDAVLFFSLQDRPEAGQGEGIPFRFEDLEVDGVPSAPISPVRGQKLRHAGD